MRVLITSARMPFALDEIRKLGKAGHHVVATDTFLTAPGMHSHFVDDWKITASPRYDRGRFIAQIREIVERQEINLVLPAFEEAFYLAWHADELSRHTNLFIPPFETLARLHDKAALVTLADSLSIPTPHTVVVDSQMALRRAIARFPRYFARASFSRGGVELLTNAGRLAGKLPVDECRPTPHNRWLVQEYVEGEDLCTFSIAHHGRITGHATYVHPRELENSGGIVFESVVDDDCLRAAEAIIRATCYHGQISFDFRRTADGVVMIECNPRPTAGVFVMSPETFCDALLDAEPRHTRIAPAGVKHMYSAALIRDMLLRWREIPADLRHLLSSAKDVYAERGDMLPAVYQLLSYSQIAAYKWSKPRSQRKSSDLAAGYFEDILWNGDAIEALQRAS